MNMSLNNYKVVCSVDTQVLYNQKKALVVFKTSAEIPFTILHVIFWYLSGHNFFSTLPTYGKKFCPPTFIPTPHTSSVPLLLLTMDSLVLYSVTVPTSIPTLDCLPLNVSTGHRHHSTWMSHHYLKPIHPLSLTV